MPDNPLTLADIHAAIVGGIKAKLSGVPTVEAYPVIERRVSIPAVLVELDDMEPGDDPGTGETALVGRWSARCIIDPNAASADLLVRDLAARVAVALTHETWGLPIGVARLIQAGPDGFKPELDGYIVWVVEWSHEFHLGETAWPWENDTGKTLMIGQHPATGAGNEGDYAPSNAQGDPPTVPEEPPAEPPGDEE